MNKKYLQAMIHRLLDKIQIDINAILEGCK